jgi:hypothetical protein
MKATDSNITPEVIKALATLRDQAYGGSNGPLMTAINVLDNAGVFAAIDEATGYDIDPEAERISKCTCPVLERKYGGHHPGCPGDPEAERVSKCTCPAVRRHVGFHNAGCPGDPAEWGDMAYTTR